MDLKPPLVEQNSFAQLVLFMAIQTYMMKIILAISDQCSPCILVIILLNKKETQSHNFFAQEFCQDTENQPALVGPC